MFPQTYATYTYVPTGVKANKRVVLYVRIDRLVSNQNSDKLLGGLKQVATVALCQVRCHLKNAQLKHPQIAQQKGSSNT